MHLVVWHGRTGRKKLGGRKEICPTFSDCARVVKKCPLPPPPGTPMSFGSNMEVLLILSHEASHSIDVEGFLKMEIS